MNHPLLQGAELSTVHHDLHSHLGLAKPHLASCKRHHSVIGSALNSQLRSNQSRHPAELPQRLPRTKFAPHRLPNNGFIGRQDGACVGRKKTFFSNPTPRLFDGITRVVTGTGLGLGHKPAFASFCQKPHRRSVLRLGQCGRRRIQNWVYCGCPQCVNLARRTPFACKPLAFDHKSQRLALRSHVLRQASLERLRLGKPALTQESIDLAKPSGSAKRSRQGLRYNLLNLFG